LPGIPLSLRTAVSLRSFGRRLKLSSALRLSTLDQLLTEAWRGQGSRICTVQSAFPVLQRRYHRPTLKFGDSATASHLYKRISSMLTAINSGQRKDSQEFRQVVSIHSSQIRLVNFPILPVCLKSLSL
jgi:hypothetical protein